MGAERSQPTEKRGGETDKNTEKNGSPETKGGRKTGSFRKSGLTKKEQKKKVVSKEDTSSATSKTRFPEKAKERPDLGGLIFRWKKSQTESSIPQTDGNVKILEIEPINFLLRSAKGTAGHYLQLYQLLKDQPCQTPESR